MRPQLCRRIVTRPSILPLPYRPSTRGLTTLAIETSCDDSAVAILERTESGANKLLFNDRISSDHRAFHGIHPTTSIVGHDTNLPPLLRRALQTFTQERGNGWKPDFISVTRGPGIKGALAIGLATAKGLSLAWNVPLVGVHHMQAHALTPMLAAAVGIDISVARDATRGQSAKSSAIAKGPEFPFLSLLVSGGHTQLVHSASLMDHRIEASTIDSAIGNVLDQIARAVIPPELLEASQDVMYARALEAFAFPNGAADYAFFKPSASRSEETAPVDTGYNWDIVLPFRESRRLAFAFSHFHSNVHRIAEKIDAADVTQRRALAQHAFAATFRHLAGRICLVLRENRPLQKVSTLVVSGGVASNKFLMHVLRKTLDARGYSGMRIVAPPPALCVDNAAMIAWTGMEMYEAGYHTDVSANPVGKWPMDSSVEGGILGLEGWLKRESVS